MKRFNRSKKETTMAQPAPKTKNADNTTQSVPAGHSVDKNTGKFKPLRQPNELVKPVQTSVTGGRVYNSGAARFGF